MIFTLSPASYGEWLAHYGRGLNPMILAITSSLKDGKLKLINGRNFIYG